MIINIKKILTITFKMMKFLCLYIFNILKTTIFSADNRFFRLLYYIYLIVFKFVLLSLFLFRLKISDQNGTFSHSPIFWGWGRDENVIWEKNDNPMIDLETEID